MISPGDESVRTAPIVRRSRAKLRHLTPLYESGVRVHPNALEGETLPLQSAHLVLEETV
jgi:hypothetical protein